MFKIRYILLLLIGAAFFSINSCKKKNTEDPDPKTGSNDTIVLNNVQWGGYTNTAWEGKQVKDVCIFKSNYYVATQGGIFKSTDGDNYSLNSEIGSTTPNVYLFATGDILFALENQGSLHSYNGSSWSKVTLPTAANLQSIEHSRMTINEKKDIFLYIRNSNGTNQLYKTSDKGSTWTASTLPNNCIDLDSYYPNALVAISKTEIFQSDDDGQTWTSKSSGYSLLKTVVSSRIKKEIYTFDDLDDKGYRGDLENITTVPNLENQTILGYGETGSLYISNITSEDNTFLHVSTAPGSSFSPLATGLATITNWSLEGEEAIILSNGIVMHINLTAQQFKSIGTPNGNVIDWQIKGKKEVILYSNTMLSTSENNGKTWLIGSSKAPDDYARCLFVDDIHEVIYVGTNKGAFSTDYYGISVTEYHQHGLGANFFIADIAKKGGKIALAINRSDLKEGAIAYNNSNSLKNFTISQIEGKKDYAIHSLSMSASTLSANLYNPDYILWYEAISTINNGYLGNWGFNKHNEAKGNPQIYMSPITSSGFGIVLFTNNQFIFSSTHGTIHGVHTLPTLGGSLTKRLYLNDDFTARGVIGNSIVQSDGPIATVIEL